MDGSKTPHRTRSTFRNLVRRIPDNHEFTRQDAAVLRTFARHIRAVPKGHVFHRHGDNQPDTVILLDGLAARARMTEKGVRRIINFLLPGEISVSLRDPDAEATAELVAKSECIAVIVPPRVMAGLEERHPRLRGLLEWIAHREIETLQDRIVASTGATVEEKLTYLLRDIYDRLFAIEEAGDGEMHLPLRQHDIADAIGASSVQVCKTLGRMRREGKLDLARSRKALKIRLAD